MCVIGFVVQVVMEAYSGCCRINSYVCWYENYKHFLVSTQDFVIVVWVQVNSTVEISCGWIWDLESDDKEQLSRVDVVGWNYL